MNGSNGNTSTTGNDTIVGVEDASGDTLNAGDLIDGGQGTDTLRVISDATSADINLSNVTNVEIIEARLSGAVAQVNTTGMAAVTDVNVISATGTTSLTVTADDTANVSVAGAKGTITVDGGNNVTVTDSTADKTITAGSTTKGAAGTITVTDTKVGNAGIAVNGGTDVTVTATGAHKAAANANKITVGTGGDAADYATGAVKVVSATAADVDAAHTMNAIDVTGGSTIEVTQTASSTKAGNQTAAWTASIITQGAVAVVGANGTSSVTVTQTKSTADANAVKTVAAVTETHTFKFGALKAGDALALDAAANGFGNGDLKITATVDMSAEDVAQAFANLLNPDNQGNAPVAKGVYTLNTSGNPLTAWTSAAASGDTVVFTSTAAGPQTDMVFVLTNTSGTSVAPTLSGKTDGVSAAGTDGVLGVVTGAVTINDDATAANAAIKTITLDGYGATTIGGSNNVTKLETLNLANSGGATDGATDAAVSVNVGGTLASLNVGVNNVNGAVTLTGAGLKTVNVTATGANSTFGLIAAAAEALTVAGDKALDIDTGSTLSALKTVTVTGSAGLSINASGATVTSVTTTDTTGKVVATIDATKATYTGGAGIDEVTTSAVAPTKAVSLGGGDDKLTLASGTTSSTGALDGGTGSNTLSMVAADAVTASGSPTFATKVTNFQKLVLTGATGAQEVEADVLGNYNDVEVKGVVGGVLTLDGLTTGATIRLNDNTNVQTVALITDAEKVANTADVLNIAIGASGENGGTDANGIVRADDVENINISVTDITTKQTPTDTKADAQSLTLVAGDATTITVTGDTALTLNTVANQKVTAINAANFSGGLTVTAAGGVATTITGGSGADVLTASSGAAALGTANATGVAATKSNDATPGVTTVVAQKAVYTINLAGLVLQDIGDKVTFTNGAAAADAYIAVGAGDTATIAAAAMVVAGTLTIDGVVYDVTAGGNATTVVLSAQTAADEADNMVIAVVDGAADGAGTNATTASQAITTQGKAAVGGTNEVATLDVTAAFLDTGGDGSIDDLDFGDTISLVVAGTTHSYTVSTATMTVDAANAELLTLIKTNAAIDASSTYTAGTDVFNLVAAAKTSVDLSIGAYTVTDASSGTPKGDTLVGNAGNDTLTAGVLTTMRGGDGNDTFVMTAIAGANQFSNIADIEAGDIIKMTAGNTFLSDEYELIGATLSDYVNTVIENTNADETSWFNLSVDGTAYTFIVDKQNGAGTTFTAGTDKIVAIVGTYDLSTAASYNQTEGTLAFL